MSEEVTAAEMERLRAHRRGMLQKNAANLLEETM